MDMRRKFAFLLPPVILLLLLLLGCDEKPAGPEENLPVRITNPADGAVLFNPVIIEVQTGSDFSILSVDFIIDAQRVSTDSSAPYQYYWNIFGYQNDSDHTLEAVGHAADTSYESAPVTVTISLEQGIIFVSAYRPASGQSFGVNSYGHLMFVATGQDGVEVLDILDKTAPEYLSRFESFGQAYKVDVRYPDIYIADLTGGVIRADFSNPDSLVEHGLFNIDINANDVAVSGDLVFVADQNGLVILDNSSPDSLGFLYRSSGVFNGANYVVARDDTVFLTNTEYLYIIDAVNPSAPVPVFSYPTPGTARAVAVIDTFAFIADGAEGVIALSISNAANPRFLARFDLGAAIVSTVDATDSTIFVGSYSGDIVALDYSLPDTLRSISSFNTSVGINELHYDYPYLFAATSESVYILRFIR
jgi:hypothetical protein